MPCGGFFLGRIERAVQHFFVDYRYRCDDPGGSLAATLLDAGGSSSPTVVDRAIHVSTDRLDGQTVTPRGAGSRRLRLGESAGRFSDCHVNGGDPPLGGVRAIGADGAGDIAAALAAMGAVWLHGVNHH